MDRRTFLGYAVAAGAGLATGVAMTIKPGKRLKLPKESRWPPNGDLQNRLQESIRQRGQLVAIYVKDGQILDGYCRLQAIMAIGLNAVCLYEPGKGTHTVEFVRQGRHIKIIRHLSVRQYLCKLEAISNERQSL